MMEETKEAPDMARAALLWVLWHHQGGSSSVGQPIRFALGIGPHDRMTEAQIAEAKTWAARRDEVREHEYERSLLRG
jgi:hypothetical protein